MQLIRLQIEGYRSLKNCQVGGFGDVNFLFGLNNSGKSNLFLALANIFRRKTQESKTTVQVGSGATETRREVETVTDFWDGYIYDEPFMFFENDRDSGIKFVVDFLIDKKSFGSPELLENAGFLDDKDQSMLEISGQINAVNETDSELILTEAKLNGKEFFSNKGGSIGGGIYFEEEKNEDLMGNEEIGKSILNSLNDAVVLIECNRYFLKESLVGEAEVDLRPDNFKRWLYGLYLNFESYDKFEGLVTFLGDLKILPRLSTAIGDNLRSLPFDKPKIGFTKFDEELELMLQNKIGRLPLRNFGTGVQQLLYLLSKIYTTDARIVLIEELELNLSPEYQEVLIENLKRFVDEGIIDQILFTSHSDYLERNDFKVYEVKIDKKGCTTVSKSNYGGLKALRRALKT